MKSNDRKKSFEWAILKEVASLYSEFPQGEIYKSENPDFLISNNITVIGIELTAFMRDEGNHGSRYKRNETIWRKVAIRARDKYRELSKIPLWVNFYWNKNEDPKSGEIEDISTSISQLIHSRIRKDTFRKVKLNYNDFKGKELLQRYIISVFVKRVANKKQELWWYGDSAFLTIGEDEIKKIILKKIDKVGEYRQKCDEVWLLIHAHETTNFSSYGNLSDKAKSFTYHAKFKKILFYEREDKKIWSLKTG